MGALLEQAAVGDLDRGIGQRRDDVGALVDVLGAVADLHLDVVFLPPSRGRTLRGSRLVGLNTCSFLMLRTRGERLHVGARHAAGAEHADHFGVLVRHVFHADAAVGADPHVLQMAVIDEGQRLAVLDRGQQDQAAVKAGPHAVFLLRHHAVGIPFS